MRKGKESKNVSIYYEQVTQSLSGHARKVYVSRDIPNEGWNSEKLRAAHASNRVGGS